MAALTDTHCHLNLNQFDNDLEEVLDRAFEIGVERILIPGLDLTSSLRAVRLAEKYDHLFAAVGVHPNYANSWNSDSIKEISDLCQHPRVAAIGEIGLDYYRDYAAPEEQKEIFLYQLDLASELQLPVVIHNRDSSQDLLPILRSWQAQLSKDGKDLADRPGVLHAFDGSTEFAEEALKANFFLGIGGPVTYQKPSSRQEILQTLSLKKILIETDSPYLSPHPYRSKRNEPANVKLIVEKISEIVNLPYEKVAELTAQNADRLFFWRASH